MPVRCNECNINWMRCYYLRWLFACRWFHEFYSILFTCLPVSPCGDYLPVGYESHEMRWLFFYRIWIAWVFWSCRVDVDNPYVLVIEIETTTIHTMAGLNPTEEPLQSFYAQLSATGWKKFKGLPSCNIFPIWNESRIEVQDPFEFLLIEHFNFDQEDGADWPVIWEVQTRAPIW